MKEIEKYNYNLVKNDIKCIYYIFKDLLKEKNAVLIMGWFQYFILIFIEAINYLEKIYPRIDMKKNLKYKKEIENCRARTKPYEIDYKTIYQKMETLLHKKTNINVRNHNFYGK